MTNRIILHGLKAHLTQAKSSWTDDLYNVLWAYRIIPHIPTGETSFKVTFGIEAIIFLDIRLSTLWTENFNLQQNKNQLRMNLDLP